MLNYFRFSNSLLLVTAVFLFVGVASSMHAQDSLANWETFDFAHKALTPRQIEGLPLEELKLLRGIVFGRHGRIFKDADIKTYLEARSWYRPNPDFQNAMLNDIERRSLDLIRVAEASKHEQVQPGDMRYWRNRSLTRKKLGSHSGAEWKVLVAEVEAIHGKRFESEPWLQQYFDERYWYVPSAHYDPKQLSATEKANLLLMALAQKHERKLALAPGDMELFENRTISESMLHGLSLYELRLLRNEIYARHGRIFRAIWLQQYFDQQPWYSADENFKDESVSGADKQNVETIVRYESRIHEELSTKPVTPALLQGLFVEDASKMRQEIYARHGKVFKETWLQKYFASLDWYKPDTNFNDASLNEIEKKNVVVIAAYEKKAVTAMSTIEG